MSILWSEIASSEKERGEVKWMRSAAAGVVLVGTKGDLARVGLKSEGRGTEGGGEGR